MNRPEKEKPPTVTRFRFLKKRRTIANLEMERCGSVVVVAPCAPASASATGVQNITRFSTASPDVCRMTRTRTSSARAAATAETTSTAGDVEGDEDVATTTLSSASATAKFAIVQLQQAPPHPPPSPSLSPSPGSYAPPPSPSPEALDRERGAPDLIKQKRLRTNKSSENVTTTKRHSLKSVPQQIQSLQQQFQSSSQLSQAPSTPTKAISSSPKQRRRSAHSMELSTTAIAHATNANSTSSAAASKVSSSSRPSEKQENSIVHLLRRVKNSVHRHAMQLAFDWVPPPAVLHGDRGFIEAHCIATAQSTALIGTSFNLAKRLSTSCSSPKRERLGARLSSPLHELPNPSRLEKRERTGGGIRFSKSASASTRRLEFSSTMGPKRHSLSSNEGDMASASGAATGTGPETPVGGERARDSKTTFGSFEEEEKASLSFPIRTTSGARRYGGSQRVRRTRFEQREPSIPVLDDDELNVEQIGEAIQLHLSLLMASKSGTRASISSTSAAQTHSDSPTRKTLSPDGEPSALGSGRQIPPGTQSPHETEEIDTPQSTLTSTSTTTSIGASGPLQLLRTRSCVHHEVVEIQIHPPDSDRTSPTNDDPRTPLVLAVSPPPRVPLSRPQSRPLSRPHRLLDPTSEETGAYLLEMGGAETAEAAGAERGMPDDVSPTSASSAGSGEATCVSACGKFVRSRRRTVKF